MKYIIKEIPRLSEFDDIDASEDLVKKLTEASKRLVGIYIDKFVDGINDSNETNNSDEENNHIVLSCFIMKDFGMGLGAAMVTLNVNESSDDDIDKFLSDVKKAAGHFQSDGILFVTTGSVSIYDEGEESELDVEAVFGTLSTKTASKRIISEVKKVTIDDKELVRYGQPYSLEIEEVDRKGDDFANLLDGRADANVDWKDDAN